MNDLETNEKITKTRTQIRSEKRKKKRKKLGIILGLLVIVGLVGVLINNSLSKSVNEDNIQEQKVVNEDNIEEPKNVNENTIEQPKNVVENTSGDLSKHNYDWSYLVDEDGKKKYIDKNGVKTLFGIDVSKHQGNIDWKKVKKENVDFAMIRIGYRGYSTGEINMDKKFIKNIEGANNVNIDTGVYFFSQALSKKEAEEEAEFVLESIEKYDVEYPIVFDMEYIENARANHLSVEEKTEVALAFCKKIEEAGYKPMIFGTRRWLNKEVILSNICKYDLWLSEYQDEPEFQYEFKIWKYTNEGKIDGISGDVDLNLCFIDYGI